MANGRLAVVMRNFFLNRLTVAIFESILHQIMRWKIRCLCPVVRVQSIENKPVELSGSFPPSPQVFIIAPAAKASGVLFGADVPSLRGPDAENKKRRLLKVS